MLLLISQHIYYASNYSKVYDRKISVLYYNHHNLKIINQDMIYWHLNLVLQK